MTGVMGSGLTAMTGAIVDDLDELLIIDKSRTTGANAGPGGGDDKISIKEFRKGLMRPRVYNVADYGIVPDLDPLTGNKIGGGTATDNSAALRTLIALVPSHASAVFEWPVGPNISSLGNGCYGFLTAVEWGSRAIHNLGMGGFSGGPFDPAGSSVTFMNLATGIAIFTITGTLLGGADSTIQATPSFERVVFQSGPAGNANVRGLVVKAAQRVQLRHVAFNRLNVGLSLLADTVDYFGNDCAWHEMSDLHFGGNHTGLYGDGVNSMTLTGAEFTANALGMDLATCATSTFSGLKINTGENNSVDANSFGWADMNGLPYYGGIRLGVQGAGTGCCASFFQGSSESTDSTGLGVTHIQVNGDPTFAVAGGINQGAGNEFHFTFSSSHASDIGLKLQSGTQRNIYDIPFHYLAAGNIVQDSGLLNLRKSLMFYAAGTYYGSGAPSFTAPKGSKYINETATTATTREYINTTGSNVWASLTYSA